MSLGSASTDEGRMAGGPPSLDPGGKGGRISWSIFLLLITLFVSIFITSPHWLSNQIDKEMNSASFWIGEEGAKELKKRTFRLYEEWVVNSGLQRQIKQMTRIKKEDDLLKNKPAFDATVILSNVGDSILLIIMQAMYRSQVFLYWMVLAAPFILAMFFTGLVERKIKLFTFGWSSANIFHISVHGLLVLAPFLFIIYFSFPMMVSVIIPMILFLLIGYLLFIITSNLQKVF